MGSSSVAVIVEVIVAGAVFVAGAGVVAVGVVVPSAVVLVLVLSVCSLATSVWGVVVCVLWSVAVLVSIVAFRARFTATARPASNPKTGP